MKKIIFAGTPEIAAGVLQALIDAKYPIVACLTQPDRPQGRGLKLSPSAVKVCALQHHIPVLQPASLKPTDIQTQIKDLAPDLMIVMAYGLILPSAILNIPRLGCINIHASILPRWRGAAPIQYSILAGDTESGITIMQMDAGMDTGDILATYPCAISATDTSDDLYARLAALAKHSCISVLEKLQAGNIQAARQNDQLATYAHKIDKQQAKINWQDDAVNIDRAIRAYNPWPVAFTMFMQQTLRIWTAVIVDTNATTHKPGTIIAIDKSGLQVATGKGIIKILIMQFPGKKALPISDLYHAHKELHVGAQFN